MSKIKYFIFAFLLSIIFIQPLFANADGGVGNVSFQPTVPNDFDEVIVVHVYSDYIPGYSDTIDQTIELSPTMMYIGSIQGIPSGNYFIDLSTYRNGDPSKTPYNDPNYTLAYNHSFQLLDGQNYNFTINFTPTVEVGTETSPPVVTLDPSAAAAIIGTPAPTLAPAPTPGVFWPFIGSFIKSNWFTILLIVVAAAILGIITIRKTIYKE